MKNSLFIFLFSLLALNLFSQTGFSKWFNEGSLRVDYILAGNHSNSDAFLQALKKEPFWGGPVSNLIDTMGYGDYICRVYSEKNNELIFSRGFSTLFHEWQTTDEALLVNKGFYQSMIIPFPKNKIRFEISERNRKGGFAQMLSVIIDPEDYFIQPSPELNYSVDNLKISGNTDHCVDIVFIPDGYTQNQMGKFKEDILRLTDSLFAVKPFSTYSNRFNFYAVMAPSDEEGTDIPGADVWKKTLVNSSFYTFDSERYLTTPDFWKVRDVAALAPYDQIYILVNTGKYGGGGIFNHYSLTSSDNELSTQVFIHEFGHGFAGLGDEYYTSDVSYSGFYSTETEPWEPNLTTLVDFHSKWEKMLKPGTPVPTPAESEYTNSTGVFEGGGYAARGVYRPAYNCRMKSNNTVNFCNVCEHSIESMILFLTE